jgi:hypothetical protein
MDWLKILQHGLKAFFFVLVASFLAVLIGALTLALGFKPEGLIDPAVWKWAVLPVITGLIAALQNALTHLPKE